MHLRNKEVLPVCAAWLEDLWADGWASYMDICRQWPEAEQVSKLPPREMARLLFVHQVMYWFRYYLDEQPETKKEDFQLALIACANLWMKANFGFGWHKSRWAYYCDNCYKENDIPPMEWKVHEKIWHLVNTVYHQ